MSDSEIIEYSVGAITSQDKKRILAKHLNALRPEFQSKQAIRDILASESPESEKVDQIRSYIDIDFGNEEVLLSAISTLVKESASLATQDPKQYLVDRDTGFIVKALEEGDIFTPPDYLGEDGQMHPSQPKVHPKISVSLALSKVASFKNEQIVAKSEQPEFKHTFEHILNPDVVLKKVNDLLRAKNIFVDEHDNNFLQLAFGHESIEGQEQSINPAYHRSQALSAILASKVLKYVSDGDRVWLDNLALHTTPKETYYTVDFYFEKVNQLS